MSAPITIQKEILVPETHWQQAILGNNDSNIEIFEENFELRLSSRGETLTLEGAKADVEQVNQIITKLMILLDRDITPTTMDIVTAIKMSQNDKLPFFLDLYDEIIGRSVDGRSIRAKNYGQLQYIAAVKNHDMVFGVGPAGTGKTFLAVVLAVQALRSGQVKRIILTRPAVEAGENLGFLPGDLKEKVDPYLRPVYDALYAIYGVEHTTRLMERGVIEVAPLAYMRGRTLEDAFVILDEAQNTTIAQMKMFLTRLGFGSKMIINGDHTQIDLPRGAKSGLSDAMRKLSHVSRIGIVEFDEYDVVRHPVVSDIIRAYDEE